MKSVFGNTCKTRFSKTSPLTTSARLIPKLEHPPELLFLPWTSEKAPSPHRGRCSCSRSARLHRATWPAHRAAGAEREKARRKRETHARSATSVLQYQRAVQGISNVPQLLDCLPRNGGTMEDTGGEKKPNVYPNRLLYPREVKKTHGRYEECLPTAAGKVEEENSGDSLARVQSV